MKAANLIMTLSDLALLFILSLVLESCREKSTETHTGIRGKEICEGRNILSSGVGTIAIGAGFLHLKVPESLIADGASTRSYFNDLIKVEIDSRVFRYIDRKSIDRFRARVIETQNLGGIATAKNQMGSSMIEYVIPTTQIDLLSVEPPVIIGNSRRTKTRLAALIYDPKAKLSIETRNLRSSKKMHSQPLMIPLVPVDASVTWPIESDDY